MDPNYRRMLEWSRQQKEAREHQERLNASNRAAEQRLNEQREAARQKYLQDLKMYELTNNAAAASSAAAGAGAGGGGNRRVNPLQLTWVDISLVPVADPNSVADWNIFFNTTDNASSPFTSVEVSGNIVNLYGASGLTIASLLFSDNKNPSNNIVSVIDGGAVVSIAYAAFANCDSLTTVNFPAVTNIDLVVFGYCDSLTTVIMPELITTNGYAFFQTQGLVSISLPKLTTMSGSDFYQCVNLNSVDLPMLQSTGDSAFLGCTSLTEISLPSCTYVSDNCFSGCTSLTNYNLPVCVNLGSSTGDNGVFSGIHDLTITLTVDPSLLTCDGGNPDGDFVYLAEYNDVFVNGVELNPKLVLWVDAGLTASYPGSGATWSNLTDYAGLDLDMTNLTYNSGNGGYFIFNGSSSKAQSATVDVKHTGGFTAEVWCQFATFSGSLGVFEFDGGGSHYINFQRMDHSDGSNPNEIRWETSSGAGNRLYSTQSMTPGTWFHVAATYNNSTLSSKLYINGVLNNEGTKSTVNAETTGPMVIGNHDDYMNGKISVVKFYKKEFLAADVLNSFNTYKSRFGY